MGSLCYGMSSLYIFEEVSMFKEIPVELANIIPKPEEGEIKQVIKLMSENGTHIFTKCGESILTDKLKPCYICKTLTNRYEISYGTYLCSDGCHEKLNKEFYDWYLRGGKE